MRRVVPLLGTVALAAAAVWPFLPAAAVRAEPALSCELIDSRGFLHRGDTWVPGMKVSRTRVVLGCGRTQAEGVPWEVGVFWVKSADRQRSGAAVTPVRRSAQRQVGASGPFVTWIVQAPAGAKLIALEARDRDGRLVQRVRPGGHVIS